MLSTAHFGCTDAIVAPATTPLVALVAIAPPVGVENATKRTHRATCRGCIGRPRSGRRLELRRGLVDVMTAVWVTTMPILRQVVAVVLLGVVPLALVREARGTNRTRRRPAASSGGIERTNEALTLELELELEPAAQARVNLGPTVRVAADTNPPRRRQGRMRRGHQRLLVAVATRRGQHLGASLVRMAGCTMPSSGTAILTQRLRTVMTPAPG